MYKQPYRRYPYFDVVVGLELSNDPQSYAGGRAFHAGEVKGDDPDYNRDPGLPVWGLGVGLMTPPREKHYCNGT